MLREKLQDKLVSKTPVISVVAILGSTEMSAVDPLVDILQVRKEMRVKVGRKP